MIDDYDHLDHSILYIPESIPGPRDLSADYQKLVEDYNSQIVQHCTCEVCSSECPCITLNYYENDFNKPHIGYEKSDIVSFKRKAGSSPSISLTECNNVCSCSFHCKNRVVQKGPIRDLYVKKCDNISKGNGLFTKSLILNGSFICEYAGEIITKFEAEKRHDQNKKQNKMNYILCLREFIEPYNIIETFVDPSMFGNIGRYINHSCEPNAIIVPVRINSIIPHVAIFSCCDISPHSEITFHYGTSMKLTDSKHSLRKLCFCNSSKCEYYLPYDST